MSSTQGLLILYTVGKSISFQNLVSSNYKFSHICDLVSPKMKDISSVQYKTCHQSEGAAIQILKFSYSPKGGQSESEKGFISPNTTKCPVSPKVRIASSVRKSIISSSVRNVWSEGSSLTQRLGNSSTVWIS